jgi:hypothetical protein
MEKSRSEMEKIKFEFELFGESYEGTLFRSAKRELSYVITQDGFRASLTQLKMLSLLTSGFTYEKAAKELGMNFYTFKSHLTALVKNNTKDEDKPPTVERLTLEAERRKFLLYPLVLAHFDYGLSQLSAVDE